MRRSQEGHGRLVVARGEAPGFLEPPKEAFGFVAVGVEVLVVGAALVAAGFGRNNGLGVTAGNGREHGVGVVGIVGHDGPGRVA